jgi:hypothetical protein
MKLIHFLELNENEATFVHNLITEKRNMIVRNEEKRNELQTINIKLEKELCELERIQKNSYNESMMHVY